ncbi:MAG: T9SS type A sorting domain-containing protein [Bacteroidetes bacterium]|nr:T9SS type A sorting domain-containing protein [Bacteroidota bacterium]MBT6687500.1 T9SS type A sorting domain-containing protein [Bacteroidota bacterium]MBT7142988.1 T9SS type A sorting domain-containing protein [Bacteroidota bacterium]MBT7491678.1 T9SS type A sorting domain-containing protein [Bacteroidota bacterium]
MKTKITFIFSFTLALIFSISVFAVQTSENENDKKKTEKSTTETSQRLVLIEHHTNTGCGPCASQNPDLEALANTGENQSMIAHIQYHPSWPGSDPMYDFNVNEGQGDARVDYYGVSGVPNTVIAGNVKEGGPSGITQSDLDTEYARPGQFKVSGVGNYSGEYLTISVIIESLSDFPTGDLVAHVVLVEDIEYATAPGSNGETYFPNAMRRMFPDDQGTDLSNPETGDVTDLSFLYTIPEEIIIENCKLIVFVQDNADKEVYMADKLTVTNCEMNTEVITIDVNQHGGSNGQATAIGYDGVPPISYLWNTPDSSTSSTVIGLPAGEYIVTITDSDFPPCMVILTVEILEPIAGINDEGANSISIYPNPTTGKINISNAENSSVHIYNMIGSEVFKTEIIYDNQSIDISELPYGNYFVKVLSEDKVVTKSVSLIK